MTPAVTLDGIRSSDISYLCNLMMSDDQALFTTKLNFRSEAGFTDWLSKRLRGEFHDFRVARLGATPVGFAHNYDFSLAAGHCKLSVCIDSAHQGSGMGALVSALFIDELFGRYPLRKVYSAIYEYNEVSLKNNLAAGFVLEGRLKEYRYRDGRYYDLLYLSLNRQAFAAGLGKLLQMQNGQVAR